MDGACKVKQNNPERAVPKELSCRTCFSIHTIYGVWIPKQVRNDTRTKTYWTAPWFQKVAGISIFETNIPTYI